MTPSRPPAARPPDSGGRASFAACLAVASLVVLGIVAERNLLAPLRSSASLWEAVGPHQVMGVLAVAALCLGSFLLLRRIVDQSIEENRSLAYFDNVTGLPNRRMYQDRFEQALHLAERQGTLVASCFLDLDGFKQVNDTLGHAGGDVLLREVAERLTGTLRLSDSVGRAHAKDAVGVSRHGGDEFTFLLTGLESPGDAGRAVGRALEALRHPFEVNGHEVFATASIGIAVFPSDGRDVETLLERADTAMYWAKDCGRNNFQFYSESMNRATERKLEVERALRRALENDELTVHYQPVRDGASAETTGAEALLRWDDAELGSVAPAEFIPIAEDSGLIVPLGAWVLRQACAQARAWEEAGYRPLRMAVNVSGHQLRHPSFLSTVEEALSSTGLSPARLELEIKEGAVMQDDEVTEAACRGLADLGVSLTVDDFGTGYSSLSNLRRLSIDRVKIDQSFVAGLPDDPEDAAVTAAIVAAADKLLLSTVGEGVETVAQAQSLRELHCGEIQGFLISSAVPAADFVRFLERQKRDHADPDADA